MGADMVVESRGSSEGSRAKSALEWLFARVNDSMRAQLVRMSELLCTVTTLVRSVGISGTHMHLKQVALSERFVTLTTMPYLWLAILQDEFSVCDTRPFAWKILLVLEACLLQLSKHLFWAVSLLRGLHLHLLRNVAAFSFFMLSFDVFLLDLFATLDFSFLRARSLRGSCLWRVTWGCPLARCLQLRRCLSNSSGRWRRNGGDLLSICVRRRHYWVRSGS